MIIMNDTSLWLFLGWYKQYVDLWEYIAPISMICATTYSLSWPLFYWMHIIVICILTPGNHFLMFTLAELLKPCLEKELVMSNEVKVM